MRQWLIVGCAYLVPAGSRSLWFSCRRRTRRLKPRSRARLRIGRLTGPVTIDGDLSDPAWARAERVDRWYETNPGDNVEPQVRSVGYLAYDDRFFYAAFDFEDPSSSQIRAPLSDRDNVSGNATDYAGVILDTRNDGRTAVLLLATPRGVHYDADSDDASGEDESPDYFWDSAARITERGWTLEIRVPFSSLRYRSADPQTWGILLYRNRPRDFRYQMFSAKLPRGGNCFICRANTLVGLEKLPSGGGIVVAPYASASQRSEPADGLGTPLKAGDTKPRAGVDLKWMPNHPRPVALREQRGPALRHVLRVGAAGLQDQLAVRALRRLRRRPRTGRAVQVPVLVPSVLRQDVVRVPAVGPTRTSQSSGALDLWVRGRVRSSVLTFRARGTSLSNRGFS